MTPSTIHQAHDMARKGENRIDIMRATGISFDQVQELYQRLGTRPRLIKEPPAILGFLASRKQSP